MSGAGMSTDGPVMSCGCQAYAGCTCVKVLFLDCDGVMNCCHSWPHNSPTNQPLDADKVALLNDIVDHTGCKIVMSSTWRLFPDCREILIAGGVVDAFHVDWSTPPARRMRSGRGDEIAEWMHKHPDVKHYCIVDDDTDMLAKQLDRFVRTSFDTGMTPDHAHLIKRILGPHA